MGEDLYSELRQMRPDQKGRKRKSRRAQDRDPAADSRPPSATGERRRRPEAAPPVPEPTPAPTSDLRLGDKGIVPTSRRVDSEPMIPSTLPSASRQTSAAVITEAETGRAPRLEATLTNLTRTSIPEIDFSYVEVEEDFLNKPSEAPPTPPTDLSRKEMRQLKRQAKLDKKELKALEKAEKKAEKVQAKLDRKNSKRGTELGVTDRPNEVAETDDDRKALRRRRRERKRQLDRHEAVLAAKVRSVRIGAMLWWIGLGGATLYGFETDRLSDPTFSIPLAAGALLAAIQTVMPWKRLAGTLPGSILNLASVLGLLGVVTTLESHIDSPLIVFSLYVAILAYSATLLPAWGYALSGITALGAFGAVIWLDDPAISADTIIPFASLTGITLAIALMNMELLRYAREAARRLVRLEIRQEGLRNRQRDLEALYEVSRTIGAGEAIDKVIPQLIERTAGYVNAKVGVMLLYRPGAEILDALSPIWAAGQPLEADQYHIPMSSESGPVWAFRNGQPIAINDIPETVTDNLIRDLGVQRIAAVPLQIENKTIGVLMVADKPDDFDEEDLNTLELLAAPAALVLQSVVRLEASQETGRKMSELAQMKSDFVSVVSHELRTPLTSVIGALSTMSRPELAPTNPTALSLLDSARGQARRLRVLIEDLLTVSKIDNKALPQRSELIEVTTFLEEMLSTDENWNAVSIDAGDNVSQIVADRDHLRRIITNLVDNARKYAPDSVVEIVAADTGDTVRLSVVDHGQGVPFQYRETIFERFTQVEAAGTRGTGGTGLGLSIVRELAEAMGGKAWYEPTVGGGATFVTEFPAANEEQAVA